jgi:NTP pyrophosphatase (non-canonical NTP hydrolase)
MSKPKIVCLCGSTRFERAFHAVNEAETLAGHIVLSCGVFKTTLAGRLLTEEEELFLNEGHIEKINLADELIMINPGGYIGERGKFEIAYALAAGKQIRYLEEPVAGDDSVPKHLPDLQTFYQRLSVRAGWDNETIEDCLKFLTDELYELTMAVELGKGVPGELADMLHYLLHAATACGIDLYTASSDKLAVLQARIGSE